MTSVLASTKDASPRVISRRAPRLTPHTFAYVQFHLSSALLRRLPLASRPLAINNKPCPTPPNLPHSPRRTRSCSPNTKRRERESRGCLSVYQEILDRVASHPRSRPPFCLLSGGPPFPLPNQSIPPFPLPNQSIPSLREPTLRSPIS